MENDRLVDLFFIVAILVILGLKIGGIIRIPWLWLLSPIWMLLLVGLVFAIIMAIICTFILFRDNKRRK